MTHSTSTPTRKPQRAAETETDSLVRADFDHDARTALEGLRDALAALLGALPGGSPSRAVDLGKMLSVGTELRWQVFTLANASDVFEAGIHVPKPGSIESLLAAAARVKTPHDLIERVRSAYGQYEFVVRAHAADRPSFDSMLRAFSAQRSDQIDVRLRKGLFQHQAVLWGLRQKVSYRCTIFHRGSRDDLIDGINLMGSVELHALRHGAALRLMVSSYLRNYIDRQSARDAGTPEEPGSVSPLLVLREFCSGPLPGETTASPHEEGGTQTMLQFEGLGRGRALNLALAQVIRDAEASVLDEISGDVRMNSPTEMLCDDMLVPAGWSVPESVRVNVYANRWNPDEVWKKNPEDRVPMRIVPTHQGRVRLSAPHASQHRPMPDFVEVPRYTEIVTKVLNDFGWADTEFDLYRCRVEYPILQSLTELVVDGTDARANEDSAE